MGSEMCIRDRPDILIVEGLNVLQPATGGSVHEETTVVSDFFDFSIYIDADAEVIEEWYVTRFLSLKKTAFREPGAYFHRYAELTQAEAVDTARDIWRRINLANLKQNIQPTCGRADLVLHKAPDHAIDRVLLRKI